MVDVLAWVAWWYTKVNSVGDSRGNISGGLGSIVGGALFLKPFSKTRKK